jgi:pyruvate kinase
VHEPSRDAVLAEVRSLLAAVDAEEAKRRAAIDAVLPRHRAGALNLAHYLALRTRDLRKLQLSLAALGLSSLGRSEGHVRDTLERLCAWLSGGPAPESLLGRAEAEGRLHENTRALLGARPKNRHVYIMVTAPDAAQAPPQWAGELLEAGADMLRINGAQGRPEDWTALAAAFKARAAALGRPGRILVDLPGPKLRAEIRQLEEAVLHLPRRKDRRGRTLAPTEVLLVAEYAEGAQLPVPAAWLAQLRAGDRIAFLDAGGRERELAVHGRAPGGVMAHCERSLYLAGGLLLAWRRGDALLGEGRAGALPPQPRELRLAPGERFVLNASGLDADPDLPVLALSEPRLLAAVREGERVVLDDGRLTAVVESAAPDALQCRVQAAARAPQRVRSGKGVAFPDSALSLGELGPRDEAALAFALEHADAVGVSYLAGPRDVALVGERLRGAARAGLGMVLKIETRRALENLPEILFEALKHHPVGLMIARGDLAVELSFERLAEMQEELLWFGEACHLPVVWATQVLDSLAHSGVPTRAEITDAAMAARAECVMLNRGPYAADAVRMLAGIIAKMEAHQFKKRAIYRPLSLASKAS